ncbi:MAG: helix-turn-helix domain-containing protein [Candidatus Woesearchaeota archaeon]
MKKETTFLLLSLEEEKAKKLSNVIGSDTCRKILDFLANREATETELAKQLGIPISTVDYNLKLLVNAGLVKAAEFHYSEKGKEVNHYSIANKYIIIAPKTTESLANKLKRILPVVAVVAITGYAIQFFRGSGTVEAAKNALAESAPMLGATPERAADLVQTTGAAVPEMAADFAQTTAAVQPSWQVAWLFILGGLFALSVYAVYSYLLSKRK